MNNTDESQFKQYSSILFLFFYVGRSPRVGLSAHIFGSQTHQRITATIPNAGAEQPLLALPQHQGKRITLY